MARKATVKLNPAGARALLQSPAVRRELERRAAAIARAAGPGMGSSSSVGPARARAEVFTANATGRRREARDRALTRAIDAGRL